MKVNIIGKGPVPGLNILAPVYNQELEKSQIQRILNYPNFRVYGADGVGLITKRSLDKVFVSNSITNETTDDVVVVINDEKDTVVEVTDSITNDESNNNTFIAVDSTEEDVMMVNEEPLPMITEDNISDEKICDPVKEIEEEKFKNKRNNYNRNKNKRKNYNKD